MRAIVQEAYGEAEVLRVGEAERPVPGTGEVLVRVRAAGVDQGVWHLMAGRPRVVRAFTGLRRPRQPIPGGDLAGVVEALGPDVTGLAVGDRVFGRGEGTFAELALAKTRLLARLPEGVSFEQAAALPVSACTALTAIRAGELRHGERVLVIGAGGGVGSFTVQLAKTVGAHVTGVASTRKLAFLRTLGADAVLDYTAEPLAGTFDVIVDIAGGRSLKELRQRLTPRGRLVIVGSESGAGLERTAQAAALNPFTGQRLVALLSSEPTELLEELGAMVASGALRVPLDRVLPLEQAGDAIRAMRAGEVLGKIVLSVDPPAE